jgi:hypothetical protein
VIGLRGPSGCAAKGLRAPSEKRWGTLSYSNWENRLGERFGAVPGSERPEAGDLLVELANAQELAEN